MTKAEARKTGIDIIGDVPWGFHCCHFYESKDDLLEVIIPFLKSGVENNEFCYWFISSPIGYPEAIKILKKELGFSSVKEISSRVKVIDYSTWYEENKDQTPEILTSEWYVRLEKAIESGFEGIRVCGVLGWLQKKDWSFFMQYEACLNKAFIDSRMMLMCAYPFENLTALSLLDVSCCHQNSIFKKQGSWKSTETLLNEEGVIKLQLKNQKLGKRITLQTAQLAETISKLKEEQQEHIKVLKALKESEENYKALYDNNPLPIWLMDKDTFYFIDINRAAIDHYGYSVEEIKNMTPLDIRADGNKSEFLRRIQNVSSRLQNVGITTHRKKDGTLVEMEVYYQLIPHQGKMVIMGEAIDVTERLKYEKELQASLKRLREVSAHLENVREEERINMSREVHDELGQRLTVLKLDVNWLVKNTSGDNLELRKRLQDIDNLINEAIVSIRKISSQLRPSLLDNVGLDAAIEWQVKELRKRTSIKIRFNNKAKQTKYPQFIRTGIYRILQESLTNAIRHSKASAIAVSLVQKGDAVVLKIADNGAGFDTSDMSTSKTFGLIGMQERAEILNGVFKISSVPEKGTTVQVNIPINE